MLWWKLVVKGKKFVYIILINKLRYNKKLSLFESIRIWDDKKS